MRRSQLFSLLAITALTAFGAWVAWPGERSLFGAEARVVQGLDLQGGLQVLLEARDGALDNLPAGQSADQAMNDTRQIIENRVNGLGVSEPVVQRQGSNRIVVELPGVRDPQAAISTLQSTGLLEFVDPGSVPGGPPLNPGQVIRTDIESQRRNVGSGATGTAVAPSETAQVGGTPPQDATAPADGATPADAATPAATPAAGATSAPEQAAGAAQTPPPTGPEYRTIMTGARLRSASPSFSQDTGQPVVQFTLDPEGARIFGDFTTQNVGNPLAIVVDKRVISAPTIEGPITGGEGIITGVSSEEAQSLAIQLRYGSLPVALDIESSNTIGATLGQDSVERSVRAGIVGVVSVALFMILYYRLPGLVSVIALAIYTLLTFATFKLIPVVLTLAGIAGFVLSIGMAVDANVLIFARLKEDLRRGRGLAQAVESGFRNAWPSIRDSNVSTLITCAILYWFGNTFGASIIRGFATTLAIGVLISMLSAIFVSRTLLRLFVRARGVENVRFWGIAPDEVVAPAASVRGGAPVGSR